METALFERVLLCVILRGYRPCGGNVATICVGEETSSVKM